MRIVAMFSLAVASVFAQDQRVVGSRPLLEIVNKLEARWAKPVHYEEPVWTSEDAAANSPGPRQRSASLPASAFVNQGRARDAEHLRSVVASFNASNPDLSYEMLQNPAGFVLVPTKRAQATVQLAATSRTVLDEQISVPIAARSPFDHLSAIAAALSARLSFTVEASTPLMMGFDRIFADAEGGSLTWGTSAVVSARNALMSLLEKSSTTMSWKLNCQPPSKSEKAFCVLNVGPLLVESRDELGKISTIPLQHDRCQKCPPRLAPPPAKP
jgi:hypothetical protein